MTTDQERIVDELRVRAEAAGPGDVRIGGLLHGKLVKDAYTQAAHIVSRLQLDEDKTDD